MATDIYSTLPPELALQQQGLTRQQEMAKALLAQGYQQNANPAGQMVSGRYVPNSFFQNLQGPVNQVLGAYMAQKGDEQALKTAQALRDYYKEEAKGFAKAIKENPEEAYITYSSAYNPAIAKTATERLTRGQKWEKIEKLDNQGNTVTYMMDVNSDKPENTLRMVGVSKPAISKAEALRLGDEGIGTGGYTGYNAPAVAPNTPAGTSPVIRSNAPAMSVAPNAPAYAQGSLTMQPTSNQVNANQLPMPPQINMAGVSPKKQREIAGEQLATLQQNVKNSYEAYPVIRDIEKILPNATAGYLEQGWKHANRFFGASTSSSPVDQTLDILATKLVMTQPRFEGPQGVLDVKLYEKAAGDLANANLPVADRMAALEQIKTLYKRYAPNLDWSFKPTPVAVPNAQKPASQGNLPPAPAGVDPAVWAVMTPQERSLWQK